MTNRRFLNRLEKFFETDQNIPNITAIWELEWLLDDYISSSDEDE